MRRTATVKRPAAPPPTSPATIGLLSAANVNRATGATSTWGAKVVTSLARVCTGASRYWKSAGSPETIVFTLFDDAGVILAQKSVVTSASGIVSVTWDSPITLAANRVYTIAVYTALAKCTWTTNVIGPIDGEHSDQGVSYSYIWSATSANTLPINQSLGSPPEKVPVGLVFEA